MSDATDETDELVECTEDKNNTDFSCNFYSNFNYVILGDIVPPENVPTTLVINPLENFKNFIGEQLAYDSNSLDDTKVEASLDMSNKERIWKNASVPTSNCKIKVKNSPGRGRLRVKPLSGDFQQPKICNIMAFLYRRVTYIDKQMESLYKDDTKIESFKDSLTKLFDINARTEPQYNVIIQDYNILKDNERGSWNVNEIIDWTDGTNSEKYVEVPIDILTDLFSLNHYDYKKPDVMDTYDEYEYKKDDKGNILFGDNGQPIIDTDERGREIILGQQKGWNEYQTFTEDDINDIANDYVKNVILNIKNGGGLYGGSLIDNIAERNKEEVKNLTNLVQNLKNYYQTGGDILQPGPPYNCNYDGEHYRTCSPKEGCKYYPKKDVEINGHWGCYNIIEIKEGEDRIIRNAVPATEEAEAEAERQRREAEEAEPADDDGSGSAAAAQSDDDDGWGWGSKSISRKRPQDVSPVVEAPAPVPAAAQAAPAPVPAAEDLNAKGIIDGAIWSGKIEITESAKDKLYSIKVNEEIYVNINNTWVKGVITETEPINNTAINADNDEGLDLAIDRIYKKKFSIRFDSEEEKKIMPCIDFGPDNEGVIYVEKEPGSYEKGRITGRKAEYKAVITYDDLKKQNDENQDGEPLVEKYNYGNFGLTKRVVTTNQDQEGNPSIDNPSKLQRVNCKKTLKTGNSITFDMKLVPVIDIEQSVDGDKFETYRACNNVANCKGYISDFRLHILKQYYNDVESSWGDKKNHLSPVNGFFTMTEEGELRHRFYEFKTRQCPEDLRDNDGVSIYDYDDKGNEKLVRGAVYEINDKNNIRLMTKRGAYYFDGQSECTVDECRKMNWSQERYGASLIRWVVPKYHYKNINLKDKFCNIHPQEGGDLPTGTCYVPVKYLFNLLDDQHTKLVEKVKNIVNARIKSSATTIPPGELNIKEIGTEPPERTKFLSEKRMGDWGQVLNSKLNNYLFTTIDYLAFLFAMLSDTNCVLQEHESNPDVTHSYTYWCYRPTNAVVDNDDEKFYRSNIKPGRFKKVARKCNITNSSADDGCRQMDSNLIFKGHLFNKLFEYVSTNHSSLVDPTEVNEFKTLLHILLMILDSYHDWKGSDARPWRLTFKNIMTKCLNIDDEFKDKLIELLKILTGNNRRNAPTKTFEKQLVEHIIEITGLGSDKNHYKKIGYNDEADPDAVSKYIKNQNYPDDSIDLQVQNIGVNMYNFFYNSLGTGDLRVLIDALGKNDVIYFICDNNIFRYPFKLVKNYYGLYDAASKGFIGFDNKGYTDNRISRDFLIGHIVNTYYSDQSFDFLDYEPALTIQENYKNDSNIRNKDISVRKIYTTQNELAKTNKRAVDTDCLITIPEISGKKADAIQFKGNYDLSIKNFYSICNKIIIDRAVKDKIKALVPKTLLRSANLNNEINSSL